MKIHKLKSHPVYFQALVTNRKRFEVRKNDQDFKLGDLLHIQEYFPEKKEYSGRSCLVRVDYILKGNKDNIIPIPEDYVIVIMSVSKVAY